MWSQVMLALDKHALWGISPWGQYDNNSMDLLLTGNLLEIRADDNLYTFKEGYFNGLRIQDIEDMLLLLVQEHAEFDESNANVLERFYTSAGNPIKEILLKLNLPDHRILKDRGEDDLTQGILDARGIFLYNTPNEAFKILKDKVLLKLNLSMSSQNPKPKTVVSAIGSNINPGHSILMENFEALTTKINSELLKIRKELKEMRDRQSNNHASHIYISDDTPMCDPMEANYEMIREWMARQTEATKRMKNQVVELENQINQGLRNRQAIIKNLERQFEYLKNKSRFILDVLHVLEVDGETIMKLETKMIAKDDVVSKFPGKFSGYTPSKEEEEEPEKKGSKEAPEKGPYYEFLSYAVSDSDSDLESTARSRPKCNELEDTYDSGVRPNT
ncbi:hypothetical protein Tco_1213674 [Tanacetum coccineum]